MLYQNSKVDDFINKHIEWQEEFKALRNIITQTSLTEELKWGVPCYTYQNNNIVLMHGFKNYCAILFVKGVLLNDSYKVLVQQTEYVQAGRQIRFANLKDIMDSRNIIEDYILQAIEIEKAGLTVDYKKHEDYRIPEELEISFDQLPELKTAFEALTPGRQRAYIIYFSAPKQSKTRETRIEKYKSAILDGKGLHDSYK